MKLRFKKGLTVPSLCCIQVYLAIQIVGQTEASYSSVKSVEPIAISSAFVFPKTIKDLELAAIQISNNMQSLYDPITTLTLSNSSEQLSEQLSQIVEIENGLKNGISTLISIHSELESYQVRVNEQNNDNEVDTYQYVTNGFLHVENIIKDIRTFIHFDKLTALKADIILKLNELKEENHMKNNQVDLQSQHLHDNECISCQTQAKVIQSPSDRPNNNK